MFFSCVHLCWTWHCFAGPDIHKQGRTDQGCEGWGQPWLQNHKMVEFRSLRGWNKANSRITALDFKRTDFGLFGDLFGIPMRYHPGAKRGLRAGWFSRMASSKHKISPSLKARSQAQVAGSLQGWIRSCWLNSNIKRKRTRNESRDRRNVETVWTCRDGVGKIKAHLDFNLVRDVIGNNKSFHKHVCSKRRTRENESLLLNGNGDLTTKTWKQLRYSLHFELTNRWSID